MIRLIKFTAAILVFGLTMVTSSSCEKDPFCRWYVDDEDGILTGYHDEDTCKDWAAQWDDVTCTCK